MEKIEMLIRSANRICDILPDSWFISEISLPVIPVSMTMPYRVFMINETANTRMIIFNCLNFNLSDPAITIGNNKRGSLIFRSFRPFLKSMLYVRPMIWIRYRDKRRTAALFLKIVWNFSFRLPEKTQNNARTI